MPLTNRAAVNIPAEVSPCTRVRTPRGHTAVERLRRVGLKLYRSPDLTPKWSCWSPSLHTLVQLGRYQPFFILVVLEGTVRCLFLVCVPLRTKAAEHLFRFLVAIPFTVKGPFTSFAR